MAVDDRRGSVTVWHGDGREQTLLEHILNHPKADQLKGHPDAILAEIDKWAVENKLCMMTIGPERGHPVIDLISRTKPKTMAELGGYIGYSAIKFGSEMRKAGGTKYYSLENDAHYAAMAETLIDFAGLKDFVQILVGPSSNSLVKLASIGVKLDVLFIDHLEEFYLKDLQLSEEHELLSVGSFIVADNAGNPRARDYVQYLNKSERASIPAMHRYKSRTIPYLLPNGEPDTVLISEKV